MSALVPLDAVDLSDVLDVLIDNVFAHTPEGTGFEVAVNLDNDQCVRLTVSDNGPEIDLRRPKGPGHTGLGLEIVRRTVEPAGGSLQIGAAPMGGTVVGVRLPLRTGGGGPGERA